VQKQTQNKMPTVTQSLAVDVDGYIRQHCADRRALQRAMAPGQSREPLQGETLQLEALLRRSNDVNGPVVRHARGFRDTSRESATEAAARIRGRPAWSQSSKLPSDLEDPLRKALRLRLERRALQQMRSRSGAQPAPLRRTTSAH
jgi:hypothetical protein